MHDDTDMDVQRNFDLECKCVIDTHVCFELSFIRVI